MSPDDLPRAPRRATLLHRRAAVALVALALGAAACASSAPGAAVRPPSTGSTDVDDTANPIDPGAPESSGAPAPVREPGWLILAWEAADNDLEAAIVDDVVEMSSVDVDGIDIVAMVDRFDGSDPDGGFTAADSSPGIPEEPGMSQILAGGDGSMSLVASVPEINSGDPEALTAFLTQALVQYPREHVALVISDHGSGWEGVAYDDTADDHLELTEISAAMDAALRAAGRDEFDVIGFDACLMATLEVGAALAPHGRYLVASEEVEPGPGWDWTTLGDLDASMDPRTFGETLVEGYRSFYVDESIIANHTMSLVDLDGIAGLSAAVSNLVAVAGTDPTAAAVGLARAAVRTYAFADAPDPAQSKHLVDIGDLAETLAVQNPSVAAAAEDVRDALDAAVVVSITGTLSEQASGLAIYLPPNAQLANDEYLALEGMHDWQGQLSSYLGVTSSIDVPAAFSDPDKYIEGTWTSGGFELTSDYDPAADATVVDARLRYGTYDEEFTSMIFYGSDQLDFGDGHVSGVWDPQVMRITDGASSAFVYSTFEVSGDRSRAIVSIPLEYLAPGTTQPDRVDLRFVYDQAGTMLSKDFVIYTSSGIGRAELDPDGELHPLAAVQSLETFEERWERTSDVAFSADITGYDGGYVPLEETTAVVAQLELHALDGSVDFVYAGDAVPFEFYADRASYPPPTAR